MRFHTLRSDKRILLPVLTWAVLIGLLPQCDAGMVGSLEVPDHVQNPNLTRVQAVLADTHVRARLQKLGLSPTEIEQRVSQMSPAELEQLATRLDSVQSGKGLVIIATAAAIFAVIYMLGVIAVDRPDSLEDDLIDLRTQKPTKRVLSPSSSNYKKKSSYGY